MPNAENVVNPPSKPGEEERPHIHAERVVLYHHSSEQTRDEAADYIHLVLAGNFKSVE